MQVKTKGFKDLIVWQKAYQLVKEIYKMTTVFPREELYGLSQQLRRAAIAIPSNIAEGYGRQHDKEYKQFLSVAYASLCELETQYLLSVDLNFASKNQVIEGLMREVGSMLYRLINPIH
ncbi:MAG: four helix bundle protein [Candidatus Omnitrophica bacterium]|nr:four helix bundle protein [Candidatus Omnitrophota bacterium]